jgi:hypothetical protein
LGHRFPSSYFQYCKENHTELFNMPGSVLVSSARRPAAPTSTLTLWFQAAPLHDVPQVNFCHYQQFLDIINKQLDAHHAEANKTSSKKYGYQHTRWTVPSAVVQWQDTGPVMGQGSE